MKSGIVAGAFVLVAFPGLWLCQRCHQPQPGRCSSSNFTINSNEVCDVEAGSCSFTQASGLCSYQQGCADPHMTNWTLEQGHIQARQEWPGTCGSNFYYSILESPWLDINRTSCLKVRYHRTSPTALDVFLELLNGDVFHLHSRSHNEYNKTDTFKISVDQGIGKILLRAYGGGSARGSRVVIYRVTLEPGNCMWSDLSSEPYDIKNAELTSPLISPTQYTEDRTDCLDFYYEMEQPGSWLAVSIQLLSEEGRTAIWNSSVVSVGTKYGKCPIQVSAPFKIIFTGYSPGSGTLDAWNIDFSRWQGKADCSIYPMTANTSATDTVIKPLDTTTSASPVWCYSSSTSSSTSSTSSSTSRSTTSSSTASLSTTTPKPTAKPTLSGSSSAQSTPFITTSDTTGHAVDLFMDGNKGNSDNSNSALIPGVVAAVAVVNVVIIIVVVIFIHRRRRLKRDQNESLTQRQDSKNGIVESKPQDNNNDDYSEIRASHFSPSEPAEDSGYFKLEEVALHPPDPDFDPYEQIPGDAPESAESPEEDDYNHLNAGGLPGKANPQESADDDDYHHINTAESTPDPQMRSVYSLAQITRTSADQPGLRYAYSQVNKKGKKMAVEDAPDPANAYSNVNKKAQKPAVALKPQGNHGQSVATTRTPQSYGSANLDEISDPYNRINASTTARNHPSTSDEDPATDPYNRINVTSDPGRKGKSPSQDDDDDYNALDFDDPTHASGAAIGSYDHVRCNPDDEYSKTGFGKRLVIDSSYDHVKLDT